MNNVYNYTDKIASSCVSVGLAQAGPNNAIVLLYMYCIYTGNTHSILHTAYKGRHTIY